MILEPKENLEGYIVKTLGEKRSLTAAQIHSEIGKQGRKYTPQAIYKELKKLQTGGVIVKLEKEYSLRLPWVLDFISLANLMSANYLESPKLSSILPDMNKKEIWHFTNLLRLNNFWSQILLMLIQRSKKKVLLGYNPHPWFHLIQTKQEEQYIRSIGLARSKLFLIIGGRTYLDKWTEKFFDKKIVVHSFGKSVFENDKAQYLNVIDDYVLTVKIDPKTTEAINAFYNKTASADNIDLAEILRTFHEKVSASIWLEKNHEKAEKIKGRFARFFGQKFA